MKYFLFIFLFLCVLNSVYIDSSITEKFNGNDTVDVIILFNDEPAMKGMKTSSINSFEMKTQDIITQLSKPGQAFRSLEIINGFSGSITEEELELIKNNPNVARVYYNYPVHIFLDDSLPLINADDVWAMQYNGKNITGQGQTVCVIDTGVDYTHPDLGNCTTQEFLDGNCEKVIGGYDFYNNDNNPIDDHGHGTHCAGIIASTHPTYKGVAPDAKIVAIKVLSSSGSGSSAQVAQGIQWCVNHKEEYNISVISMSLGEDFGSSNYCNGDYFASYINSAVANNITVVIATGNDYSYNYVSSPACVQNALRVTSTTKSDLFASYANRGGNFNDIIAAPGGSNSGSNNCLFISGHICSTWLSGGFFAASGTSMATPHVAGVVALYNQYYYDRYGRYVSPSEIKQKLNDTGVQLYDSLSGKNYSRVDVLELFNYINLDILGTSVINSYYNNSDDLYFEINLSKEVSNVYVNMTLPNQTNEIISLTNYTLTNYNGTYTIPNLHGNYSFVYVINDSGFIDYSNQFNFTVLYDYICVNYSDCNSSLFEYNKILLNNSLSLEVGEYFIFGNNTEFNCNNYEINNSNYIEVIGENSSLENCILNGGEFEFNSTLYTFNLTNISFVNNGFLNLRNVSFMGDKFILIEEKVIANSFNDTNSYYKFNVTSCEKLDVLYYENLTNLTTDFLNSNVLFVNHTCVNNSLEFNSSLNGSYTYNNFNISVSNTTGGLTNTIYNYTYLFNITNNNLINDNFTISFNSSNSTIVYYDLNPFIVNSNDSYSYEFNVSNNVSGNYSINFSLCSLKTNRCYNSTFIIEILEIPSFENVTIYPYALSNNSNVTFNLNVSNYDSIWFDIILPNLTIITLNYLDGINYTTDQIGMHNVTFYANDTFNYISNYSDYFEVFEPSQSNFSFKDSEGNLTNVTLKLFYREQELFNDTIDNSSIEFFNVNYNFELNFSRFRLLLNNSNLTNDTYELIVDEFDYGNYFYTLLINNSLPFEMNYSLQINYSGLNYTNDTYLEFYKCSSWDFINNTCLSSFEKKNFTINTTTKILTYSDNSFSAFSILQGMYCGDGVCNNNETCSSCKGDCGSCPSGGSTGGSGGSGGGGGGGGGGAGGGAAILPKDARYQNITYNVYNSTLFETSEYKLHVQNINGTYIYTFYSLFEGNLSLENDHFDITPFEIIEFNSTKPLEIKFEKIKLQNARTINLTNPSINLDNERVIYHLNEFNKSRENEKACSFFLGYHNSPCLDKESCLFACRSMPLCGGLSNSEIFLNLSNFVYINIQKLDSQYEECYDSIGNATQLKNCVMELYNTAKQLESSPLFGTCPTCLGVCKETNYSYSSLNEILFIIDEYEKSQEFYFDLNVVEYNGRANKLDLLLNKYIEINKTISYSNLELDNLIQLHNNYSSIESEKFVLLDAQYESILKNITLYNEANCTSEFKRFFTLNQFNGVLSECLNPEVDEITVVEKEDKQEPPNVLFIIGASILILIIIKQIMKRYH